MDRRGFLGRAAAAGSVSVLGSALRPGVAAAETLPPRAEVLAAMKRADDHWIAEHADPGSNGWDRATYFSGVMAHYRVSGDARYLDYTRSWAEVHGYGLIGGNTTRNADSQCAGQVYFDLYDELGGEEKIANIEACLHRMTFEDQPEKYDDWWWVDALHMAMPGFTRLGALRADTRYWVKMYRQYHWTKRQQASDVPAVYVKPGLLSEGDALWYRDGAFVIDGTRAASPNGRPVYWSRGNGWAIAAHAKVLKVIPATDKRGPEYVHTLRTMAAALAAIQRQDGFWNVNLGDPDHHPGPETSGTAFFTYGIAAGINAGLLDRARYLPVVARAWNGMVTKALQDNGFLGYVQGAGGSPDDHQPVTVDDTADFGVGAFLLAGSEITELAS